MKMLQHEAAAAIGDKFIGMAGRLAVANKCLPGCAALFHIEINGARLAVWLKEAQE